MMSREDASAVWRFVLEKIAPIMITALVGIGVWQYKVSVDNAKKFQELVTKIDSRLAVLEGRQIEYQALISRTSALEMDTAYIKNTRYTRADSVNMMAPITEDIREIATDVKEMRSEITDLKIEVRTVINELGE